MNRYENWMNFNKFNNVKFTSSMDGDYRSFATCAQSTWPSHVTFARAVLVNRCPTFEPQLPQDTTL